MPKKRNSYFSFPKSIRGSTQKIEFPNMGPAKYNITKSLD